MFVKRIISIKMVSVFVRRVLNVMRSLSVENLMVNLGIEDILLNIVKMHFHQKVLLSIIHV